MPAKRKAISKKVREEVFNKFDGHCAYCGKELTPKNWQLDHLIPVQREQFGRHTVDQIECFDNYVPSCRSCNHYKRAHSLEVFRRYIEEIPKKLQRDSYIYRIGKDYGLVADHCGKVEFYFEFLQRVQKEDSVIQE